MNFTNLTPSQAKMMLRGAKAILSAGGRYGLLPVEQAYRYKRFGEAFGMQILFGMLALGMLTGFSPIWVVMRIPYLFLLVRLIPAQHLHLINQVLR